MLKASLYFSNQTDKIRKSKIFTTFEKIHRSFINNLKSEETKSQIKAHLSCLATSYFYNYKLSPRILRQHRVLQNLRINKDIFITKPENGSGVVILDNKLLDNAIQEIISDISKLGKLNENSTLNREASLQRFLSNLNKEQIFLTKMNMINCILLVPLLLVSMALLKYTNFPPVIYFLNFIQLFHL